MSILPSGNIDTFGYIPGELSFAANSRELARTRANSRELRANSPTVRQHRQSAELWRTFAGVRRTFAGVRRSSPGFARVRPHSAANSRTVRQKIRSREEIYPLLVLTVVRANWFAANVKFGERVRQNFLTYGIIVRYREQVRHPRTNVRRELMFAGVKLVCRAVNYDSPKTLKLCLPQTSKL